MANNQEYNANIEKITKVFQSAYKTNGIMKPKDAVANYKFLLKKKMAEIPGKPTSSHFTLNDLKKSRPRGNLWNARKCRKNR
jgi:hypothetical protein